MQEISVRVEDLTAPDAIPAAVIQTAIDDLGDEGGRVVLPAVEVEVDRGIELRSGVTLLGQGRDTVLRKAPGRVYPLAGYHNYGMLDVPLMHTEGLAPGMTVAIRDDRHGGFFETFARITWVEDTWVGLDQGLHSDYDADGNPMLVTAYPLIFGLGVENVAVQGLTLDGRRADQAAGIGACRGAAIYFLRSHGVAVTDVVERDFAGEGLGFQMCSQVHIRDSHVAGNAGNGFHPGAGSTAVSFHDCSARDNDAAGFFFCVRANHVTVQQCSFNDNAGPGVSVGTRDSDNLIEACTIRGNGGPGLLFRETRRPVAMRNCRVARCDVTANAVETGEGQIAVHGEAHALAFVRNRVAGGGARPTAGFFVAPRATDVWLKDNVIEACSPRVIAQAESLTMDDPVRACGLEAVEPRHYRHVREGG
jgi:hypothetical protein